MKKNIKAFALVLVLMCVVSDAMANPAAITAAMQSVAAANERTKKASSNDASWVVE